jgi:hypothetical protein
VRIEIPIEGATGATVGVSDEHWSTRCSTDYFIECGNDPLGSVVQVRRQILHLDRLGETIAFEHGTQFGHECAAGDDQRT